LLLFKLTNFAEYTGSYGRDQKWLLQSPIVNIQDLSEGHKTKLSCLITRDLDGTGSTN